MDTRPIQAALTQLHYDWHNFSVNDFTRHVAHQRQRELYLLGIPLVTTEFSGMCVIMPATDYIFFDTNRHPAIQQHTILHELAHLIFNHTSALLRLPNALELMALVQRLQLRSAQARLTLPHQQAERQAEYFAFLVQQAAVASQQRKRANQTDRAADMYILPFSGKFFKDS
jgi:Zn-dependent peptidase ImmA (M78 family)